MATGIGILKVGVLGPTTTSLVDEFSKVVLDKFSAEILDLLGSQVEYKLGLAPIVISIFSLLSLLSEIMM